MKGLQRDFDLQPFNTFGIALKAREYYPFTSVADLEEYFRSAPGSPFILLGGGSNLLFTSDFPGTILHNQILGVEVLASDEDSVIVEAGAGENWHQFVQWCVHQDFGGLENLSLIPGKVGAAPIQNIGAYGVEVKDIFHHLLAYDTQEHRLLKLGPEDCDFSYRYSRFKGDWKGRFIIIKVAFRLSKHQHQFHTSYGAIKDALPENQPITIRSIADAVIKIRQSKLPDPAVLGNAGSFFKNPIIDRTTFNLLQAQYPEVPNYPNGPGVVKVPAGWLIDQCGWKGKRVGQTGCYEKQALVIVNYGGASGTEIWSFAQTLMASVEQKFGITLEPEVNVVGTF